MSASGAVIMGKLGAGAQGLGLRLSPEQLEQFQVYYQELVEWNRRLNLTRITAYEEVQIKHFLDSLTVALALQTPLKTGLQVIDIGSGAGFPGLPLKILLPDISLVLLEATAKKAEFLRHVVPEMGLDRVEVVAERAETLAHQPGRREAFDLVLSRAVSALPALAELALPFCAVGGSVIAQKKGDIAAELRQADRAINTLGGKLRQVKPVELPGLPGERYLVIIDKLSPTPGKYPRRPGIPEKRPLA